MKDFTTIAYHLVLSSAILAEQAKAIPVFFFLSLSYFHLPNRIFIAKPEDLEMWPNHLSFRFWTGKLSLSTQQKMGTFFELGNAKAAKGEGWAPPFISCAQDTVGF